MTDDNDYLTGPQAAALIPRRPHPATLGDWRRRGIGPPCIKVGGQWRYPRAALLDWIASRPRGGDPIAS